MALHRWFAALGALVFGPPALAAPPTVFMPSTVPPQVWAAPAWTPPGGVQLVTETYVPDLTPTVTYVDPFKALTFKGAHGDLPYRLLSPATPQEAAPLVLVLHSSGPPMGTDNFKHLSPFSTAWADPVLSSELPAYVVLPQTNVRTINYFPGSDGQRISKPEPVMQDILALVDELAAKLPVDRSRIYLVGFSMGAGTALQALLERPGMFAAVAAFSAIPPDRTLAPKVAHVPMLLVHGDADPLVEIGPDLAWAEALAKAGAAPRMIVYRGMDHRLPPDMAQALAWRTWLFEQRLPLPAIPEHQQSAAAPPKPAAAKVLTATERVGGVNP